MSGAPTGTDAVDPIALFSDWFEAARQAGLIEPDALTLATADPSGRPSARVVLLKFFDAAGFVFATNYRSRKAVELDANPRAALVFWWPPVTRQVRVEGHVERCEPELSDRIHEARARASQLSAWASPQSEEISDRVALQRAWREQERRFPNRVPRPEHWGGYRLIPERIEFWEGGPHRLHDRLCFRRSIDGSWTRSRLAP